MTRKGEGELPQIARDDADGDVARGDETTLRDAFAELVPPAKAPPQLLRERLLATVMRPRLRYAPLYGSLAQLFDLSDTDLANLFERAASPDEWVTAPIPGTQLFHLSGGPRVAHADNGLVRIRAGTRFPFHRHLGPERVLVLEGAYLDEQSGLTFRAGDLHEMAEGTAHAYVAQGDCALLLAVSVVRGVDVEGYGALSAASK
ncbi:MAG TPA: cupin domain-containing protein [Polyangiaceae bacterium]|nr:cupin domain-containing protein [Polyangiaceae bacterium]